MQRKDASDAAAVQMREATAADASDAAAVQMREATAADASAIRRMVSAAHLDPTQIKWQNFLVAEREGQIVGIGQIRQHQDAEELGSLIVLPDYQGQGIGGQLIRALEARAGRPLYLFCLDRMESYYARFGYQMIAYGDLPPSLRVKLIIPSLFRVFGLRIITMCKRGDVDNQQQR